jgi:hypothetical protein
VNFVLVCVMVRHMIIKNQILFDGVEVGISRYKCKTFLRVLSVKGVIFRSSLLVVSTSHHTHINNLGPLACFGEIHGPMLSTL